MRCARGDRANAPSVHQPTRLHDLTASSADVRAQFRWETINAIAYKLGGLVFIIGSILFFPKFEAYADVGACTFFAGSLIYLLVTMHDLLEVWRNWRESSPPRTGQVLDYLAALSYVWGPFCSRWAASSSCLLSVG